MALTTTTSSNVSTSWKRWMMHHPQLSYFGLAYAITWLIASPLIATRFGWFSVPPQLHYLCAFGPLLAAFVVTGITSGSAGLRELGTRIFKWRVGRVWVLIALVSPVLLFSLSALILRFIGAPWPDFSQLGRSEDFPAFSLLANWMVWVLTFGIGEETGWRGFALPKLQCNHHPLIATLLLSVWWALWHAPMFFYRPQFMGLGVVGTIGFFLGLLTGALILTWLYNSTGGSVLVVALWHGTYNTIATSPVAQGTISAVMSLLIMVWAMLLVSGYVWLSSVSKHTEGARSRAHRTAVNWHRLFNPIVIWLLRSPLHRLLSAQMMVMTVTGRSSGTPYTFPVSYIRDGETLLVLSHRGRTWWKQLQGGAAVTLTFEGHQVNAFASSFTEEDVVKSDLLQLMRRARAFQRVFHLPLDAAGQPTQPEALTDLASTWVTVRVREWTAGPLW